MRAKNKRIPATLFINQMLFLCLGICLFLPGEKQIKGPCPMAAAILIFEIAYLTYIVRKRENLTAASDLMMIVWAFLLLWEIVVTKKNMMHPVLVPAPENVFYVFYEQPVILLKGVWSSLKLLFAGVFGGLAAGVVAGLVCGWIPRLRNLFYPIANVLAPIPSIVFAPYIVALMPSFRSASMVVIVLGIFWPTFLNMIIRVDGIEKRILDSARALNLNNRSMIFQILLPYAFPGVISGLKVTMTTAVMMLTFAEMMGATSGMGYYIVNYNTYGNYTNVVAGIMVVGVVVTVLNKLVAWLQKKLIRWQMY
ncbi:ABC transporter permease [Ruminococcus sp. 5_1_39BFAA]|uniref:ABC transporter permease n=1 Tax=Ruminococcus sp. 5_1_39BFAA TaxID=457412 RepID=UPI003563F00C